MAQTFSVAYLFKALDKFTPTSKNINRSLKKQNVLFKKLKANAQKASVTLAAMSAAMTAAFVGSTMAAAKFEDGLFNVLTLLDQAQIKRFKGDLDKAQESAVKMGFSIEDSNKALFDTVSALGLSENSMKAFRVAQKLSIAGNATLGASVLGLAKIMNVYGRETTDSNRVANALFSAQKVGTTTVEELALNVGKISGASRLAGLGYEEMLATLSVLTNVMRNTEEASTAMGAVLKAVTTPAKQSKQIFDALGITYGISNVKAVGFSTVLGQISKALKTNEDAVAAAIPEIRAFRGIASLTEESLRLMDKTVVMINEDIKNGTGLNKAYALQMTKLSLKFKMVMGNITVYIKQLAILLFPAIKKVADIIIKVIQTLANMRTWVKVVIVIVASFAFALTLLSTAIVGLLVTGGALVAALNVLKLTFIATWIAALGPIGLIAAGLLALSIIGTVLYRRFKPFRDLIISIFGWLKKIVDIATFGALGKISKLIFKNEAGSDLANQGSKSRADINVNLNAPKGAVQNVETNNRLNEGFNLGTNMQEA